MWPSAVKVKDEFPRGIERPAFARAGNRRFDEPASWAVLIRERSLLGKGARHIRLQAWEQKPPTLMEPQFPEKPPQGPYRITRKQPLRVEHKGERLERVSGKGPTAPCQERCPLLM